MNTFYLQYKTNLAPLGVPDPAFETFTVIRSSFTKLFDPPMSTHPTPTFELLVAVLLIVGGVVYIL